MIKPGKYLAKISDYGVVLNKNGAPQVKVVFALEVGSSFSWFGNLGSEKQQEFTTKNLLTLGAFPNNIDKVELGLSGAVLNTSKTFELVIEEKTYNGKTSVQIKFINDPTKSNQKFIGATGALGALKGQAVQIAATEGLAMKTEKTAGAGF